MRINNKPRWINSIQSGGKIKTPCKEFVYCNITLFQMFNNSETHQEIKSTAKLSQSPDATPSFTKRVTESSVSNHCLQPLLMEVRV